MTVTNIPLMTHAMPIKCTSSNGSTPDKMTAEQLRMPFMYDESAYPMTGAFSLIITAQNAKEAKQVDEQVDKVKVQR